MLVAKLVVGIVSCGACGASLLALRQGQFDAAHELASSRLAVRAIDEELSRVRAEIAGLVHPAMVAGMIESLGKLEPAIAEHEPQEGGRTGPPSLRP